VLYEISHYKSNKPWVASLFRPYTYDDVFNELAFEVGQKMNKFLDVHIELLIATTPLIRR
jgi:hypothetical protein